MKKILFILVCVLSMCVSSSSYAICKQEGKTFTVSASSTSGEDTGYTLEYSNKTVKVNGKEYKLNGTYHIMRGSKGGLYIVIGTTDKGKQVKYYALPKEVKETLKK